MVDFAIWPFIYRMPSCKLFKEGGVPQSFALLTQWIERMRSHEIVAPRVVEDAAFEEFNAHYRTPASRFDEIQTKTVP